MSDQVVSKEPPRWVIQRVANPLMRRALPSRLGARIPVGLLRFTGRRTGRRYDVPVGVHRLPQGLVVVTDAPWRLNFRGGADAELVLGGRTTAVRGELVEEPARVGPLLRAILDSGVPPRRVALQVAAGHRPTDEECAAVRQAILLR
jgi:hypothetical protein